MIVLWGGGGQGFRKLFLRGEAWFTLKKNVGS